MQSDKEFMLERDNLVFRGMNACRPIDMSLRIAEIDNKQPQMTKENFRLELTDVSLLSIIFRFSSRTNVF